MRNRVTLALVVGSVLAMGVVGAAAVLIVDTVRAGDTRPEPCTDILGREASGELLDDTAVIGRAWAAVSDREGAQDVIGDLGGSLLVTRRTCVLHAGVLMGSESHPQQPGPTVVFAESNVAGYQNLARFAEVRLPESDPSTGTPQVAVAAHSVLLGNELNAGLVLPLSGAYLAPEIDSTVAAEDVDTVLALTSADGVTAETQGGADRRGRVPDRGRPGPDARPERPGPRPRRGTSAGRSRGARRDRRRPGTPKPPGRSTPGWRSRSTWTRACHSTSRRRDASRHCCPD